MHIKTICLLAAGLWLGSMPALCDTYPGTVADSSKVIDLDEVVVVAQPKEQARLRLQPLSSSVFGSEQMERLNIHDLSDLSQYVPSFTMPAYGSRLTSSLYIRGIGTRINNPAVGVYYDNIPLMSKAAFNNHFYMLDRVDVLRGPQGTLYGQNTEGGLVRIYSKNPMNYQGTDIRLGIGTGLYSNVEVAHHHRPSEQLAFTVAGFYSGLKGFIDNANFDAKNDLTNEAGGKVRLIYQPTQQLTFDWTADYQYVNQNGFGYGEFQPDEGAASTADPATTLMNGYKRNMLNTGLSIRYAMPRLLFTSTTSYQYLRDLMVMDQDYMAPDYLRLEQRQKQNALTQEFVLRSQGAARWQHASGLFGSYQWLRTDAPVYFGEALTGQIGQAIETAMKNAMVQAMLGRFLGQGMSPEQALQMATQTVEQMGVTMTAETGVSEYFHTPQANIGLFHESNIMLTDQLKLTLGLRLNHDRVKADYDSRAYMAMTGGVSGVVATNTLLTEVADNLSKSYTQLLPKLGLTYQFAGSAGNIYATVSKGYRAGGYNIQMFSDILQAELNDPNYRDQVQNGRGETIEIPHTAEDYANISETIAYKPEESWNFEAGAHLNLFSGRVQADLALYRMQIRNQQLSVMSSRYNYGRIMVNAGKSHSLGAEVALRGKAADNRLEWAATYAFTSAKFDEYRTAETGDGETDYADNYVPYVPQHTFSIMADYHLGKFTVGASLAGQGKTWWDEANTYAQNLYATLGAHADYDLGIATITLWGRNLTDTRYNTFAVESSAAGGTRYFAQRANPLQVGMDVKIHF